MTGTVIPLGWTPNRRETVMDEADAAEFLGLAPVRAPFAWPWQIVNIEFAAVRGKYVKVDDVIGWLETNAEVLNVPAMLQLRDELVAVRDRGR